MTSRKRQVLKPNRWTGWKPEHTVEVELVERTAAETRYALYLNGEHIGYVLGHPNYHGRGRGGWGYTLGKQLPPPTVAILKTNPNRARAVEHAIERALLERARATRRTTTRK